MPLITADQAPVFELDGNVVTGLAAPSRGANDVAVWRLRLIADNPSVTHALTREETFVVLTGTLTARFDDHEESAAAGDALVVPAGRRFSLVAEGGPVEALCVLPVGGQAITDGAPFTPPWAE
jgi:mannose-6-phosphate isomerase-like protein (cupin superfamily)